MPRPSGVTRPIPVTTTRLIEKSIRGKPIRGKSMPNPRQMPPPAPQPVRRGAFERSARSAMRLDESDGVLDRHDLLGRVIGNFAAELFLERHDQLDGIEAVRPQIVDEAGIFGYLGLVDAEMLDNDLLNPLGDVAHAMISSMNADS